MNPKTSTTFGELKKGDRFYFIGDKNKIPYQLTGREVLSKKSYNIIDSSGVRAWNFDKQAPGDRPVIFLRHTLPQPHEQYTIQQLQAGSIFFLPGDIITEYKVIDNDSDDCKAVCLNDNQPGEVILAPGTPVIFIKHENELAYG